MNRVQRVFEQLRQNKARTIIPFVCGGYPAPGALGEILSAVQGAGAPIVEIGVPFSDPIADGPVIAAAMHAALEAGSTPLTVINEVRQYRESSANPPGRFIDPLAREMLGEGRPEGALVAMVSMSIAHRIGSDAVRSKREAGVKAGANLPNAAALAFCRLLAAHGFDGLIVPDCPLEEASELTQSAADCGLTMSHLIAPTTPLERAGRIAKASTGFVYVLARSGVTGETDRPPDISGRVGKLRELTDLPIAVGFGIGTAVHVRHVVQHADAAIVGSALVGRMTVAGARGAAAAAGTFVRELAAGLR